MDEINLDGYPPLSKKYILEHVSQEQIFEKFTGLTVIPNYQYKSPFRQDNNAGCNYYYSGDGTLRFNDWAGYFHGDCFDAVGFRISVDANTKDGFKRVLDHIAQEFRLWKYADENEFKRMLYNRLVQNVVKLDKEIDIKVIPRDWNSRDAKYWGKIHATKGYLNYFNVYPAREVYLNNNVRYIFRNDWDLAYCYDFGKGRKRIYFPFRTKFRFLGNTNILQGIDQYQYNRVGLITKSYKDVIAIKVVCHNYFPISSTAPTNEKYKLTKEDYRSLKYKTPFLFSLYDFNRKGEVDKMSFNTAIQMRRNYNITPLFLTNGRFKTVNYKAKDFSEFLEINGIDKTRHVVERVYEYFEQHYFEPYETEVNRELQWIQQERPY